jgi:hypothetical protein
VLPRNASLLRSAKRRSNASPRRRGRRLSSMLPRRRDRRPSSVLPRNASLPLSARPRSRDPLRRRVPLPPERRSARTRGDRLWRVPVRKADPPRHRSRSTEATRSSGSRRRRCTGRRRTRSATRLRRSRESRRRPVLTAGRGARHRCIGPYRRAAPPRGRSRAVPGGSPWSALESPAERLRRRASGSRHSRWSDIMAARGAARGRASTGGNQPTDGYQGCGRRLCRTGTTQAVAHPGDHRA